MVKRGTCLQRFASSRSAQVTIFLAIGLIILISLIILSTAKKESVSKLDVGISTVETGQVDDTNIRSFVQFCVDIVAKNAVFYLGFLGGKLQKDAFPQFYVIDAHYKIPYYYYEGGSNMPNQEGFKNLILAKYMNENLRKCTNNFEAFGSTRIVDANSKTSVQLTDNEAIFNVTYPVSINRGFHIKNLDSRYSTEVKVRLKDIIKIAQDIISFAILNDRYIHWDYLTDVSNKNYNITAYTQEDNTILYRIIDLENEIDKEPYIFQFANKINVKE